MKTSARLTLRESVDFDELTFTHAGLSVTVDTANYDNVNVAVSKAGTDGDLLLNLLLDSEGAIVRAEPGYAAWDGAGVPLKQEPARPLTPQEGAELWSALTLPDGLPDELIEAHAALWLACVKLQKLHAYYGDTDTLRLRSTAEDVMSSLDEYARRLQEPAA